MLKFTVYERGDNEARMYRETEFEPTDIESLNEIKELSKNKSYWVSPETEDSAAVLFQRARRKSNWNDKMATYAHECALEGINNEEIKMKIYAKFQIIVTTDSVAKTLRQEANLELDVDPDLRAKVEAIVPKKSKRGAAGRMTPELEAQIHEAYDAGMTGKEVGAKFGFSDSHVNKIRREKVGSRVRGRKVAEPQATPIGVAETA